MSEWKYQLEEMLKNSTEVRNARIRGLEAQLAEERLLIDDLDERCRDMATDLYEANEEIKRLRTELDLWREYAPYLKRHGMFPPESGPIEPPEEK